MTCARCKRTDKEVVFYRNSGRLSGYNGYCKECSLESLRRTRYYQRTRGRRYARHPDHVLARNAVYAALRGGRLEKQPCAKCGAIRVQAHHSHGYQGENRLKVEWLCITHHRQIHAN